MLGKCFRQRCGAVHGSERLEPFIGVKGDRAVEALVGFERAQDFGDGESDVRHVARENKRGVAWRAWALCEGREPGSYSSDRAAKRWVFARKRDSGWQRDTRRIWGEVRTDNHDVSRDLRCRNSPLEKG